MAYFYLCSPQDTCIIQRAGSDPPTHTISCLVQIIWSLMQKDKDEKVHFLLLNCLNTQANADLA